MPSLNLIISPADIEARKKLDFRAGDTVKVLQKVREGSSASSRKGGAEADKIRLQAFEGLVLSRKHGHEPGATFTLRKVIGEVGVERIFPLYSPEIDKIEIKSRASKHKRSKLYYIREKAAREVRRKIKSVRTSFAKARSAEIAAKEKAEVVV